MQKLILVVMLLSFVAFSTPSELIASDCADQYAECLEMALDNPSDTQLIIDKQFCDGAFEICAIPSAWPW